MSSQQPKPPSQPSLVQQFVELKDFRGLSVKPDIVNRPPNSWRRLDNFDLYIPGSIRKVAAPSALNGQAHPVVILAHAEFIPNDAGVRKVFGVGTDGNIYDLNNPAAAGISLGVGSISTPVWMGLLPGTLVPYTFITWQISLLVTTAQSVIAYAKDGNKYIFKCTTGGTTGSVAPPAWPTSGTVSDGSAVWTNQGLQDQATFEQNYLVIIVQGQQPLKFDGTNVTAVGVTAPSIPINLDQLVVSTSYGYAPITGRYYAWTWFNPKTLHESAPSPVRGALSQAIIPQTRGQAPNQVAGVPFYASDQAAKFNAKGSFLPFLPQGQFYSSVGLTLPQAALTPPIGSGYTHIRFYATQDGGSQLYLIQSLYDVTGDQLCDANGAVAISQLGTESGYEAVSVTQALATQVIVYDGIVTAGSAVSQDTMPANNDLLVEGSLTDVHTVAGTLTVDPDLAIHLYPRGPYLVTSASIAASAGTSWTIEARFRALSSNGGGGMLSFGSVQLAPTSSPVDKLLWMNADGHIHFAYHDSVTGKWVVLNSIAGGWNDGNPHAVDVRGSGSGVDLYLDGVHQSGNALFSNTAYVTWIRIGIADLSLHPGAGAFSSVPNRFQGTLDEVAFWPTTDIGAAQIAANNTQAGSNANYGGYIVALTPQNYWRLDDLSSVIAAPTPDAALVFPAPALTDHWPPPVSRWGAVFQGSLVVQDDSDAATLWSSDVGDFESYGEFNFDRFQTENDDDVVSLVGGLNLLVVGTLRRVDSLSGTDPSTFVRQPIDSLHGFLGHRCVFPLGSKIVGLMRQGFATFDLNMSFGATSQNIQLGYGDASLIGDDILPILQSIAAGANLYLTCIAVDNAQNILLFAIKDANGVTYNDVVLMYTMGATQGWSKFLPPGGLEYPTIRETLLPSGALNIIANASDKNSYILFNTQSPASPLTAVAETQALPTPLQTEGQMWDTDRDFLYMYVEGQDLSNFTYQFAVDYPNNSVFTTPALKLSPGMNLLGGRGKQIVVRFTHSVNPSIAPALISYVKIAYNIHGRRS